MKPHIQDYFEGILQVRNGSKELLDWICDRIRTEGRAKVSKAKKVTNGVDLYMTDQHYLQNLGRKIKEHQMGILKVSRRLHTQDKMTSKHIYRVTVLFKAIPFKRGDIITFHGEQVQILNIGTKAQIKDIKSGAKRVVELELLFR
ncbi:NMD3 family protein [uncultured archaeon]|nr:NMD3 family protein [uncultured archaeon]